MNREAGSLSNFSRASVTLWPLKGLRSKKVAPDLVRLDWDRRVLVQELSEGRRMGCCDRLAAAADRILWFLGFLSRSCVPATFATLCSALTLVLAGS